MTGATPQTASRAAAGAGGTVRVALALGSNLGDRMAHLAGAVRALAEVVRLDAVSSVWASDPVGPGEQPEYLNAVVTARTALAPRALLEAALEVEARAGRERPYRDAPRTLDVDVVLYGGRVIRAPGLVVPHPRWRERGFVLAPLREVAPDWVDPETGRTVAELADGAERAPGRPRRVAGPEALDRAKESTGP